jgi:hypothetical protein
LALQNEVILCRGWINKKGVKKGVKKTPFFELYFEGLKNGQKPKFPESAGFGPFLAKNS